MSDAIVTEGMTIEIGDGDASSVVPGSDTFKEIGEITQFNGPGGNASIIDVTHFKSTAREKLMGLQDWGQFSLTCNYVPTDVGQVEARTVAASRELKNVRLTLTDSGAEVWDFTCYVTGFTLGGGVDSQVTVDIGFEVTGSPTVT